MNDTKTTNIFKYVFVASIVAFFASLFVQLQTSNKTALKGKDFLILHDRKVSLEKEIAYLRYQDSTHSSLESIEERAKKMGFVKMSEPLVKLPTPSLASLYTQ